jgi:hypothetical protein
VAGYREFQTGEVLTAANVNDFLMEQSVMTFADATARAAALSGVLREGILTYNEDTAQLEVYDGSAFVVAAPAPPAGIGSNVVQTVKTDTFTTSSTSTTDVTGLTATITPSSTSSKVLVIADVAVVHSNGTSQVGQLFVTDGSDVSLAVPDSPGSRLPSVSQGYNSSGSTGFGDMSRTVFHFLASPNTTSPVTYKVRARFDGSGLVLINRNISDTDNAFNGRSVSTITLIEVAA